MDEEELSLWAVDFAVINALREAVPEFEPRFAELIADDNEMGPYEIMDWFASWFLGRQQDRSTDGVPHRVYGLIEWILAAKRVRGGTELIVEFLEAIAAEARESGSVVDASFMGPVTREHFDGLWTVTPPGRSPE